MTAKQHGRTLPNQENVGSDLTNHPVEIGSHPIHPHLDWIHPIGSKIIGLKLDWIYATLDLLFIGLANDWI